jgi:hypothetical protein
MFKNDGLVKFPRSILAHILEGRLTPTEFTCYVMINLLADPDTGAWVGSACTLAGKFSVSIPKRTARSALEALAAKGYVKRFARPGVPGNYPILVHGYEITEGPRRGMRLNALATFDPKALVYECPEREA